MTSKKKANGNEPTSPAIKDLEEKKAKIEAKINRLKEKERKLDARKKILAGGWLLALARTDESAKELLEKRFIPSLKNRRDLELFMPEAPSIDDPGRPRTGKVRVKFTGKPAPEVLAAMKAVGRAWKWDAENSVWTGEANPEAVRNAVAPIKVKIMEA